MNYQDVKTKTINWCTKMKDVGLLTPVQYDNCITSFTNSSSGIISKDFIVPSSGMPINYSLYNTRTEAITDNIIGKNTNTIMLVTNTGLYMACDTNNNIYYIKNINDHTINQNELYFTLKPHTNNLYSLLSPYGRYLLSNVNYTVDFTGTTMGPLASWKINKVNDSVTFESLEFTGYYLSFVDNEKPLQIIYGEDESSQWIMIPKPQTNIKDQYAPYIGTEYIVKKEDILTRIINKSIDKIVLNIIKNTLTTLQNNISENFAKIDTYMRKSINYDIELFKLSTINYNAQIESLNSITLNLNAQMDSVERLKRNANANRNGNGNGNGNGNDNGNGNGNGNDNGNGNGNDNGNDNTPMITNSTTSLQTLQSLTSSIPKPVGINLTPKEIEGIFTNIANTKNMTLKLIDEEISKINIQISNLPTEDPMTDYVEYMNTLKNEYDKTTLSIQQNNVIMGRQKDNYDTLNKDENYFDTKTNNYKKLDNSLKLNFNIVDGYKTQNKYLIYIYPLVLILCIFFLIYLIYITYKKFMENVYTQYE